MTSLDSMRRPPALRRFRPFVTCLVGALVLATTPAEATKRDAWVKLDRSHSTFGAALAPTTRRAIVRKALRQLRPLAGKFDTVVGTGLSGMAMAPVLAHALDKPLALVRSFPRSSRRKLAPWVERDGPLGRVLLVDEHTSTGATIRSVRARVAEVGGELRLVYLYEDGILHDERSGLGLRR